MPSSASRATRPRPTSRKPIAAWRRNIHPDLNPGRRANDQQFREITAAYDLLVGSGEAGALRPRRDRRQRRRALCRFRRRLRWRGRAPAAEPRLSPRDRAELLLRRDHRRTLGRGGERGAGAEPPATGPIPANGPPRLRRGGARRQAARRSSPMARCRDHRPRRHRYRTDASPQALRAAGGGAASSGGDACSRSSSSHILISGARATIYISNFRSR